MKRNHMLGILSLNNPEAVQVHIKKAEVLSAELKIMGTAIDKQVGSPVEFKEVDPGVSKHWSSWKVRWWLSVYFYRAIWLSY